MFEGSQLLSYMIALAIAAAIPGPGMTAFVARSVSCGAGSGMAMLLGLICGDLFYLSFAVFGLAIIAHTFETLFSVVKFGSAVYLCYLAWSFWHMQHQDVSTPRDRVTKDFFIAALSGFTITLSNPKTIAFYLALLPVVMDLQQVTLDYWALTLIPITVLVLLAVGALFVFGALAIRRTLSSAKAPKVLFHGAASAMVLAASTFVVRS